VSGQVESRRGYVLTGLAAVVAIAIGLGIVVLRGPSPSSVAARDFVRAYFSGNFTKACDLMAASYQHRALSFVEAKNCPAWAADTRGKLNKAYESSFGGTYDRLNADTTWKVEVTATATHDETVTVTLDVHGTYADGDNARYKEIAGSKSESVTVALTKEKGHWRVVSDTL